MAYNGLSTRLRQIIDMNVFSELLETDDTEERNASSSAVYRFIEAGENTLEGMNQAL